MPRDALSGILLPCLPVREDEGWAPSFNGDHVSAPGEALQLVKGSGIPSGRKVLLKCQWQLLQWEREVCWAGDGSDQD